MEKTQIDQAVSEALEERGGKFFVDDMEIYLPADDEGFCEYVETQDVEESLVRLQRRGRVRNDGGR